MSSTKAETRMRSEVKALEDTRRQYSKAMESSMPREVARSLDAVARLARDHNVQ
jgi:hypothetical protein